MDQALAEAASMGADTKKIILSQYQIKPCLGHDECASFESCRQKDDAGRILDQFCEADGVILATPIYWYSVSAQMKTFIDRNYFLYRHDRKYRARTVGVIIVADTEGIKDTLHTLNQFIDWSFSLKDSEKFTVIGYANKLGEAKTNLPLVEKSRMLGSQMAALT